MSRFSRGSRSGCWLISSRLIQCTSARNTRRWRDHHHFQMRRQAGLDASGTPLAVGGRAVCSGWGAWRLRGKPAAMPIWAPPRVCTAVQTPAQLQIRGAASSVSRQPGRQIGRALEVEQAQDLGGGGLAQGAAAAVGLAELHLGGFAGDAGPIWAFKVRAEPGWRAVAGVDQP